MTGKLGGDAGEADLRTHYDNIAALQKNRLNSRMRKIIDTIGEPHGFAPGSINFEWVPLWQMSELEEAKVKRETAESDRIYIETGVVEPEEVAVSRFGDTDSDIAINTERREKYLDQLNKQPMPLGEVDEPPDVGGQVNLENPGNDGQIKNAGQGVNDI